MNHARRFVPLVLPLLVSMLTISMLAKADPCYTDVIVSGAGFDEANGRYTFNEMVDGRPTFYRGIQQSDPPYRLSAAVNWVNSPQWGTYWVIAVNVYETGGLVRSVTYKSYDTSAMTPPRTGWVWVSGMGGSYLPPPTLTGGESCSVPGLKLEIEPSSGPFDVGDDVVYTYIVTNTGNTTLSALTVEDSTLFRTIPLGSTSLAPDESTSGTTTLQVTQAHVDQCSLTNWATAFAASDGGSPVSGSASATVDFMHGPDLALEISAPQGPFHEGEIAVFTYTVHNMGNVTLSDPTVHDDRLGWIGMGSFLLRPGDSTSGTETYVITEEDVQAGSVAFSAVATAETPCGPDVSTATSKTILCEPEIDVEIPAETIVAIETSHCLLLPEGQAPPMLGSRPLAGKLCQAEPLTVEISATTPDGAPVGGLSVYATLFSVTLGEEDETRTDIQTQRTTAEDGVHRAGFDTSGLEAGVYDLRIWIAGREMEWRRFQLTACGDNEDGDGVSDAVDACPSVAGPASNAGCPKGDFDRDGIPDTEACSRSVLAADVLRLRVVVDTTSDLTLLRVEGGELLVANVEILNDLPQLEVESFQGIRIWKPCCIRTHAIVAFEAYLLSAEGESVDWILEKTDFGTASVEVYVWANPADESSELIQVIEGLHRSAPQGDAATSARSFSMSLAEARAATEPAEIKPICISADGEDPLVLATYFPRFGPADNPEDGWIQWDPKEFYGDVPTAFQPTDLPAAGFYDSLDEAVIRQHIEQAQDAGINGFLCSWRGIGLMEDRALDVLLPVADEMGFKIGFLYDVILRSGIMEESITHLVDRSTGHPSILRVDDAPVIVFSAYATAHFHPERWLRSFGRVIESRRPFFAVGGVADTEYVDAFDGLLAAVHRAEAGADSESAYAAATILAKMSGTLLAAEILPGFPSPSGATSIDRAGGTVYRSNWEAAVAGAPHWIVIQSFNNWADGTQIEPSAAYGMLYLDLTRELASEWQDEFP